MYLLKKSGKYRKEITHDFPANTWAYFVLLFLMWYHWLFKAFKKNWREGESNSWRQFLVFSIAFYIIMEKPGFPQAFGIDQVHGGC